MQEKDIEQKLLEQLQALGYTYRKDITDNQSLEKNFKSKLESLNHINLSSEEFKKVLDKTISHDVFKASINLRRPFEIIRDDDTTLKLELLKDDWCKNDFEVINQLRINTKNSNHRYDVIILINGLPLVQIELKNGVNPTNAITQINKYKKDEGNGYTNTLMCFMQMFIVSNYHNTFYFANNNNSLLSFTKNAMPVYTWTNDKNEKISNLSEFANIVLEKCPLARMLERYIVLLETKKQLLIMRPYQIKAVEKIIKHIEKEKGNGYIWHTTGSGKTLTSFKAATLLKQEDNSKVYKCLFVVDRKDLDRQTVDEFNKYQAGCVDTTDNTNTLIEKLISDDYKHKIIVTTLQKLSKALKSRADELSPIINKPIVFIFDECHRSQFGETNKAIKKTFTNSRLYGFTGTPIFPTNANNEEVDENNKKYKKTTETIFGKELHKYTIANAIDDKNVLAFEINYPLQKPEVVNKKKPSKQSIVEWVLKNHAQKTANKNFNAIFATASINDAIEYYNLFKTNQKSLPKEQQLQVACVFSSPNYSGQEDLDAEKDDYKKNPQEKKEALAKIIHDFNPSYSIDKFDTYYNDIQKTIKDHNENIIHNTSESLKQNPKKAKIIDIVIVVDMLLTGFDSHYTNTLYVDKNLKYHGLIQGFSRTNRVLYNDEICTKPHGNIISFSTKKATVDEAIALFSSGIDEQKKWLVENYTEVKEKVSKALEDLKSIAPTALSANNLKGQEERIAFLKSYRDFSKLRTQISQYNECTNEAKIDLGIDYNSIEPYHSAMQQIRTDYFASATKEKPLNEIKEDFDLTMSDGILIDYDYIIALIASYQEAPEKKSIADILKIVESNETYKHRSKYIKQYLEENLEHGSIVKPEDIKQKIETLITQEQQKQQLLLAKKIQGIAEVDTDILPHIQHIIMKAEQDRRVSTSPDIKKEVDTILEYNPNLADIPIFMPEVKDKAEIIYKTIEEYLQDYDHSIWKNLQDTE